MELKWKQIPLGPLQTNAYIIEDEQKECIIIDPGSEGKRLIKNLEQKGLTPIAILLTHAHFDHIGAVDDITGKWSCPVYVHENEQDWLSNPSLNGSKYFGLREEITAKGANEVLTEEGLLQIGSFCFEVYETPGHSPGSVSFYMKEKTIVFSGDALFARSIGRTDLPGGSHRQLIQSIHEKLLVLPEETIVASGHGPLTTIGKEMNMNPFLNGF
ncbi:MBL fold metallo-hydrolase [Calidifontibacillus oryziterrae]|uniref:MBL fold metallo-hydrolase n=1 Tax=Calidifontibacillus oryziterrae TaxID=1191699 RepID=UPI00030A34DF|nr:MBL fold metallo-hydrolase [Calidifontibacillus oryziterrae]